LNNALVLLIQRYEICEKSSLSSIESNFVFLMVKGSKFLACGHVLPKSQSSSINCVRFWESSIRIVFLTLTYCHANSNTSHSIHRNRFFFFLENIITVS